MHFLKEKREYIIDTYSWKQNFTFEVKSLTRILVMHCENIASDMSPTLGLSKRLKILSANTMGMRT